MSLFNREKREGGEKIDDYRFEAVIKSPELIKKVYEETVKHFDLIRADNVELRKEIEDLKERVSKQEIRENELRGQLKSLITNNK